MRSGRGTISCRVLTVAPGRTRARRTWARRGNSTRWLWLSTVCTDYQGGGVVARETDLTVEEQRLALKRMREWEDRERLKVEALPPEEQDVVLELVALLNVKPVYRV